MPECSTEYCYTQPRTLDENGVFVEDSNRTLYRVSEDDVLAHAQMRGIRLTEDELNYIEKGIEAGLSSGADVVIDTALDEILVKRERISDEVLEDERIF